jgi:nudix-type nucleoside diphosphatase (YffH/AdpP family)
LPAEIIAKTTEYEGWSKIYRLRIRLADGEEVSREVEEHGSAVAVLPYDPQRRVAMLVRLLRAPVLMDVGLQELLEAPAGLIEEDDPAETARREVHEEVGLKLTALEPVAEVWSSPGISTERMHLFLAAYGAGDKADAGGGVAGEHENIKPVELPLHELWSMLESGAVKDLKTCTLLLALKVRHPELF